MVNYDQPDFLFIKAATNFYLLVRRFIPQHIVGDVAQRLEHQSIITAYQGEVVGKI